MPVASGAWEDGGWSARWPYWVGGVLGLIVVAEIGLLVYQAMRPLPVIELPRLNEAPLSKAGVAEIQLIEIPPLSAHAAKPLFVAPVVAVARPVEPVRVAKRDIDALAARLSLLGIVAGEPTQAIIEDSKTKKTHFVTQGQIVVEDAVVSEILDTHVVLDVLGDTIRLTL